MGAGKDGHLTGLTNQKGRLDHVTGAGPHVQQSRMEQWKIQDLFL